MKIRKTFIDGFSLTKEYTPASLSFTLIGSLSSDLFERRTSTLIGLFAPLGRDFEQIFGRIVSIRIKTLGVASRIIKREKGSLPVDVRRCLSSQFTKPSHNYENSISCPFIDSLRPLQAINRPSSF